MEVKEETRVTELRRELQEVLTTEPVDYAQILELSTELAKLDPENVRFFADAGLISRLGRELVSRKETALAELVKNAYDADSTSVDMVFEDADLPGGNLEISDNGTGMTRESLIEGFMRLSSMAKVLEPISPQFERQRAGRKGIGRFAVQRLGQRVVITTQTYSSSLALRIAIDWDRFEGGKDLSNVASQVEQVEKKCEEGTTLLIEGLRDGWTDAAVNRAYRYVSDLLQPFPLTARMEKNKADPGFKVNVFRQVGEDIQTIADEESQFLDYALAKIEGVVDEDGRGYWSIESRKFPDINELVLPIGSDPDDPVKKFLWLRDIRLRAYYYISQVGLLPHLLDRPIRNFLDEQGGIRVYRNGFRVLPYGEYGNDWLGMDQAQARRKILPPLSNRNVYGFIEIFDPAGEVFEETASREGLIENPAFEELQNFASRILRAATLRVASARDRKPIASGREDQIENPPEERIREATRRLREAGTWSKVGRFLEEVEEIDKGLDEMERERRALLGEIGMLRVLAGLGIVISEFTHEIRQLVPGVIVAARELATQLKEPPLAEIASDLHQSVQRFRTYASYFDQTVQENVSRDLDTQELGDVVQRFVRVMRSAAERTGTAIEKNVEGIDLHTIPMHPSEWVSILFNLYSNAQKAIKRMGRQGRIYVCAGRSGDQVHIEFADNGDGIPAEYADRIFEPFFTTSIPSGGAFDSSEDMQGSGLGLKIVRDIVEGYGGRVTLVDPPQGYVTCFRVEVPLAKDNDLNGFEQKAL